MFWPRSTKIGTVIGHGQFLTPADLRSMIKVKVEAILSYLGVYASHKRILFKLFNATVSRYKGLTNLCSNKQCKMTPSTVSPKKGKPI